jgi:hypothetical protein
MSDTVPTTFRTQSAAGSSYRVFQAEDAVLGGPKIITDDIQDYGADGGAFVDFVGRSDQTISWIVDVAETGVYGLDVIYALAAGRSPRPMTLSVDGAPVETLSFAPNSDASWSQWGPQSTTLALEAGRRVITLTAPGGNGPNLDALRLTAEPAPVAAPLTLTLIDAADPSAVLFETSGGPEGAALAVSLDGGATVLPVTPDAQGRFTLDLSGTPGPQTVSLLGDGVAAATVAVDVPAPPPPGDGVETVGGVDFVIYEAERAALAGPVVVPGSVSDRGASDGAFVDYKGRGDQTIAWTVEVDADGLYRVDVIYQLVAGKAARPMTLSVDGQVVGILPFAANAASESDWGPQGFTLQLGAGRHVVALTAPNAVGPDVDYLRVSAEPLPGETFAAIDGAGRIELETLDGSATAIDPSAAEFRFTVAEDGVYALEFAANDADAPASQLALTLNGAALDAIAFPGEGEAGETVAHAFLRAGTEIRLGARSDEAGAGDLDHLDIRRVPAGGAALEVRAVDADGAFFDDRLAFSIIERPVVIGAEQLGSLSNKDSGVFEIRNTGVAPLTVYDAAIDGPFVLADPAALDGLTLAPGESLRVTVRFDPRLWADKPASADWGAIDAQQAPAKGALTLLTNAADAPRQVLSFGAHWQLVNEYGMEATVNEVWEVTGFGNRIEGLPNVTGGAYSVFSHTGEAVAVDETEVISAYWRVADGHDGVTFTNLANYSGPGSKSFHIHAPGDRNAAVLLLRSDQMDSQRMLPTAGEGLARATIAAGAIPAAWTGDGVFGLRVDGYSSDPRLNNLGDQVVDGVQLGLFVKIFQALDADGAAIPDTWLVIQDVNGANADYNDSMWVMQGAAPVGSGARIAAPAALAFDQDEAPNDPGLTRVFTIANQGVAALTILDVGIEGADAADFAIVSGLTAGQSIAAGATASVTVRFTGSPQRAAEAVLAIESSDGPARIALTAPPDFVLKAGDDAFAAAPTAPLVVDAAQGLLANDRLGGGDGVVVAVDGVAVGPDGTITARGSAGGQFVIGADGSLRFDPGQDFADLAAGAAVATEVSYAIRGADGLIDSAWVTVAVSNGGGAAPQTGLSAEYFATNGAATLSQVNFHAAPAQAGRAGQIDFASTRGGFWPGGPGDDFAARFAGKFETPGSGAYTFSLLSDDGAALYIDGRLAIDHDGVHAATTKTAVVTLSQGVHDIELRYFERAGDAALRLDWQGPGIAGQQRMAFGAQPGATSGLAEFYALPTGVNDLDRVSFTGKPTAVSQITQIAIDAGQGAFWAGGPVNNFAARFTGDVTVTTAGAYTFHLTSDDGSELFVDGVRVIDNDFLQAATQRSATVSLGAGTHAVEVRYYEAGGFASVDLDWTGPDTGGQRDQLRFAAAASGGVGEVARPADVAQSFSVIENAEDVALALPAQDADGDAITIAAIDQPEHGTVRIAANGVATYTPDRGYEGVDSFRWFGADAGGEATGGLVSVRVKPAQNQPQTALDARIAPQIDPSGDALILRKVAELPDGVTGAAPRMDSVLTHDGAIYVATEGVAQGESKIYRLTPDGDGGYDTALWFDVGAAVFAETGRQVNNSNVQHGGLRGIAFHPDFETNGKLYTAIMEDRPANPAGHTYLSDVANPVVADGVLLEWTADPATGEIDPASYREVFRVGMPVYDHSMKQIAFNPFAQPGDADYGLLYVAHGDGSVQSATAGGGQNADALGKVLRVNPLQDGDAPYSVPADNPFVGDPAMLDEVYALGFRNPHTLSFAEDATGAVRLIVADVGRDNFDEINIVEAGGDYGWSRREGPLLHLQDGGGVLDGVTALPANEASFAFIYPNAFYAHSGAEGTGFTGQAIAGGIVPDNGGELDGRFIFGDFGSAGRILSVGLEDLLAADTRVQAGETVAEALSWAEPGEVQLYLDADGDPSTLPIAFDSFSAMIDSARSDFRFGKGLDGELLVINKRDGAVYVADNTLPGDHARFQSTDFTDALLV